MENKIENNAITVKESNNISHEVDKSEKKLPNTGVGMENIYGLGILTSLGLLKRRKNRRKDK